MRLLKSTAFATLALVCAGVAGFFVLGQVSQNGLAAGLVEGRLAPCPDTPNCVSSEAGTAPEAAVQPLPLDAWETIAEVVSKQGGTVTSQTEDYIAAEFRSAIFGFVDDVEFSRRTDEVHVRSASRVGYSDAGANAARVAMLREAVS